MGAHSNDEMLSIVERSFNSISTLLGDKPYMFGDNISSLDIIVFSLISSFTLTNIDNDINQMAKKHKNLVSLTKNIQTTYYS